MAAPRPSRSQRHMPPALRYDYCSAEGLAALKDYKYSGTDNSIIAPYLQPFWNGLVQYLPRSLAPNTITLLGLLFILVSFFVQAYYCPLLKGAAPAWTYVLHAVCMFFYQTLDALDGKQARRMGASSPLGELFDHGCDALTTTLATITVITSMQLGGGFWMVLLLLSNMLTFFSAQWEQFHSGVLVLGKFNVTEAQYVVIAFHLVTAAMGGLWWNTPLFTLQGYTVLLKDIPLASFLIMAWLNTLGYSFGVLKSIRGNGLASVAVTQAIPAALACLFASLWHVWSPTRVSFTLPLPFFVAVGFVFATLVGKVVLARMCGRMRTSPLQPLVLPLALGALNARLHVLPEAAMAWAACGMATLAYLHLAVSVIDELTVHLDIDCFSIEKQVQRHQSKSQ